MNDRQRRERRNLLVATMWGMVAGGVAAVVTRLIYMALFGV